MLATGLAFINEFKANKEFDVLNQVSDDVPMRVIRDGKFTLIPRKEIVVGDLALIEAGEEVPADGTLFEAVGLQINESGLTGESEPADKVARNSPKKSTMRSQPILRTLCFAARWCSMAMVCLKFQPLEMVLKLARRHAQQPRILVKRLPSIVSWERSAKSLVWLDCSWQSRPSWR